ncbi:DNA polymerase III subunit chi [Aestuariibacter salexigens]|uniref:DNA polymerase III subunit chi n=1 Tax=Aestuariibacter salexigens TaxID=226010 RepID=UPI0004155660|nr:DNA polymerase III subunit chi [Aestuariibacter salexigens]
MTTVTFYQLNEESDREPDQQLSAVCHIAAAWYSAKKRCVIWCADQASAEHVDEWLWQLPADRFIPHNLTGEGPQGGAPVELAWQQQHIGRPFLINMAASVPENITRYQQIAEFVPADEPGKQAARQRYKEYQRAGCDMAFMPVNKLYEKHDG